MAESPGSEGRRGPPPIPPQAQERSGEAQPAAAPPPTSLQAASSAAPLPPPTDGKASAAAPGTFQDENTAPIAAPKSGVLAPPSGVAPAVTLDLGPLDEVATIAVREVEATPDAAIRADLSIRLALLYQDLLDDPEAGLRHALAAGVAHPVALRFVVARALGGGDGAALDGAVALAQAAGLGEARLAALHREAAEAWLYRLGDPARAAALLREALRLEPASAVAGGLLPLALALSGDWAGLADLLAQEPGPGAAPSSARLLEAAHVRADRLGDAPGAAALLERVRGDDEDLSALVHLLELAASPAPPPGVELVGALRRARAALAEPAARADQLAVSYLLAVELERRGALDEAAPIYAALAAETNVSWGARLALLSTLRLALARAAWEDVAKAYEELAAAAPAPLAIAYRRRTAAIRDSRLADGRRALDAYLTLASGGAAGDAVLTAVERLRFATDDIEGLVSDLEAAARARPEVRATALARAADLAEARLHDLEAAIGLRRESLGAEEDLRGCEEMARLLARQGDRVRLAATYRRAAQLAGDDRAAGAYLCAAGALELAGGRAREAEELLREAARKAPRDLVARVELATVLRRASRWRELTETLQVIESLSGAPATRAATLRELGRVTASKLADTKAARAHLERALELAPQDAGTLHALAELCGEGGDWEQAVALRERAVVASGGSLHAAALLLEIGEIEEKHRKDDEAARRALERALAVDERSVDALRALAQLHRKTRRYAELLGVLRRELELTDDAQRRLSLNLEIARHADQVENDAGAALDGYRAALAIDPANGPALAGVERLCRRDGRHDVLAEVFRAAPQTARNLRTLGEALEKLERWPDLAEVRRAELELTEDGKEVARLAFALAGLYDERIGAVDDAARFYRRALELEPGDARTLRALAHLYETHGRYAELVDVLERELKQLPEKEAAPRVAALMRIAALRRDRLGQPGEAAGAFEAVLELEATHLPALEALEALYGRLGRETDLLHVLERKAVAVEDKAARAQAHVQLAELRERRGDADGALAAYRGAFTADPSSRNTFTALERLCYKRERWSDAMDLYDAAIELVESKGSRAYRLGDLYSRRGQIQLQYLGQAAGAAASYLRVVELDPDNDTALRFLESIYSQQSDWVGLIRAYEKRADLTSDDEKRLETLRRAARVASAKQKDAAEAARLYERVLQVDPTDGEALDALERHYERSRDWEKLVSVLTMRLATAGGGDALVSTLARIASICEEGLRDETRAIDHYRRILEVAPGNKDALEALGRIYESTEKWVEFIDITRRQIRVTTDRSLKALLYFKCGSVMESKFSKEEDAIRYYDAAIKTSPSCLPAVHGLRDLYLRRKDWARVIQTLELEVKLWQDDKERAGVFAQIGTIYGDHLHDGERALHYFESALAVDPECLPANKALFELHFSRGEYARAAPLAQALAQKAMREGEPADRSEFYRRRGIVARQTGDPRTAAESLIIALEIKPDNLPALDEVGSLARAEPDCYDFGATYRELEKIYRKRDDAAPFLARCLVAQAALVERTGDLDTAEKMYADALALVPHDFTVLLAGVQLQTAMRRWPRAADTIRTFLRSDPPPSRHDRIRALLQLAEIHADGEMDAGRAAAALDELLHLDPDHGEALYLLAQELFVLGRFAEARQRIERVIEIAAAPGATLSAEALARYYYYLGRILEEMGEGRAAGTQYRRAAEYDASYAPPVLALAKRMAQAGDLRGAENMLIQSAHAAMERAGALAAVPLQRGLARILLAEGERKATIEAYRGILAVDPENAEDRVALAEIYAMEDLPKAVHEVHRVLERDLRHSPAYRLLATLYERMGLPERALRVNTILELLGYSEEEERVALVQARARRSSPHFATLTEDVRSSLIVPAAGRSILTEVYAAVAEQIAGMYVLPPAGTNLVPAAQIDDPSFRAAVAEVARIYGVEPEVHVGDEIYGGMVVLVYPRPVVTIRRDLFANPEPERRFLLGRACDSIRGLYAPLMRLNARERTEVGNLLRSLLLPETERPQPTIDFVAGLPRKAQKAVERFAGYAGPLPEVEPWMNALAEAQDRAGLLACDAIGASVRMLARLNGEELAVTADGAVAIGSVPRGMELVRFFLSDDYHRLVASAGEGAARPA